MLAGPGPRLIDMGNPLADHPLNAGLAAWWLPLPNNSGGVTLWDIVRGNNGVLTNGPLWVGGAPGAPGAALRLDGVDDYITTANVPSYASGNFSATWNIWVRLIAAGSFPMLVTKGSATVFWLGNGSNQIPRYIGDSGASVDAGTALTLGKWYMITAVADTFAAGATLKMYLNGQLSGTGAVGYPTTGLSAPVFGRRSDGFYANIDLASVQYFFGSGSSCALPASRVAALYDQGLRGHPHALRRYTPAVRVFGGAAGGAPPGGANQNLLLLGVG